MTPETASLRVAVLGAAGYVGGELLRLLSAHPAVARLVAYSHSHAGRPWSEAHPVLQHVPTATFEAFDVAAAARAADVVYLALPHGKSSECMGELLQADPPLIVDLAADFRIQDRALFEAYYGPHPAFEHAAAFRYGLADVHGAALHGARRIAAPGCFATACQLALYPLVRAGLIAETPVVWALTGSSGAGVQPKRTTHHPVRAHNLFAYSLGGHRHEAEIADEMRRWGARADAECRLLTHSAPLVRGIHATLHARLQRPLADPLALYAASFAGRPFVHVKAEPPELAAVVGTNFIHVHAAPRAGGLEVVATTVIDNLVKGAAGQAIQAMNLALGLPEAAGLEHAGLYPC